MHTTHVVPDVWYGDIGSSHKSLFNVNVDLSALPPNAPNLLDAPTSSTPAFIAISIGFSTIFFILFTMISLRTSLGPRLSTTLERPALHRASAWLGFLGFMIGTFCFIYTFSQIQSELGRWY
jgi:hypothetical protein